MYCFTDNLVDLSIHDLTRRSTVERHSPICHNMIFQFTTSHGGRHTYASIPVYISIFQFTTSHGGRHTSCKLLSVTSGLSIHDLTRRSTPLTSQKAYSNCLSIHDLTRRSTALSRCCLFRSPFQFTTSHGGRLIRKIIKTILTLFQFTTSHGGRPEFDLYGVFVFGLSIHDLTRRSTLRG